MSTENPRERIMAATLACFEQRGMTKTSLEDVAAEAQLSRSTLYRYFPGGREQLVSETVTWEVGNFLVGLGAAVADDRDLHSKLTHALAAGHRAIGEHRLLQQLLSTEPEAFFHELVDSEPIMEAVVRDYLDSQLALESMHEGRDRGEAADYLARLFLSFLGSPGHWNLDDPVEVDRLVRTQFLAGILQDP